MGSDSESDNQIHVIRILYLNLILLFLIKLYHNHTNSSPLAYVTLIKNLEFIIYHPFILLIH